MAVAAIGPERRRSPSPVTQALCRARTCYGHFAGQLGVGLADALRQAGYVLLTDEGGEVTERGVEFLRRFGVALDSARKARGAFCRPCLDWTERRLHVGGAIGTAIADRCFALGWVKRERDSRAVALTRFGIVGFRETFGLLLDRQGDGDRDREDHG